MHILLIPTMDMDLCLELVSAIHACPDVPDKTIIVNNSGEVFQQDLSSRGIYVRNFPNNIGVNAAWNIGLRTAEKYSAHLTILNDDILVKEDFFKRIASLLADHLLRKVPVFCPTTTPDLNEFDALEVNNYPSRLHYMKKREGWAFTIRDTFIEAIGRIPKKLYLFYGDDWIWRKTVVFGKRWMKDERNIIFHEPHASQLKDPFIVAWYKKDGEAYREIWEG